MSYEKETARQHYLENFKRENDGDKVSDLFEVILIR